MAQLFYNLGLAYQRKELHKEAITQFERAVELDGQFIEAYRALLGFSHLELRTLTEAISAIKRAIFLDLSSWKDHYNLGVALSRSKKFEDAALACEQAIKLNPECVDVQVGLGNTHGKIGKVDLALRHYLAIQSANGANLTVHKNMPTEAHFPRINTRIGLGTSTEFLTLCKFMKHLG